MIKWLLAGAAVLGAVGFLVFVLRARAYEAEVQRRRRTYRDDRDRWTLDVAVVPSPGRRDPTRWSLRARLARSERKEARARYIVEIDLLNDQGSSLAGVRAEKDLTLAASIVWGQVLSLPEGDTVCDYRVRVRRR